MRPFLACAVLLVATRAYADDPQAPAPQPPPADPQAPAPTDPASTDKPEPKPDPAYGEKPDPAYDHAGTPTTDRGYYSGTPAGRDIVIRSYPDRSKKNMIGLGIAAGTAVVLGGVGLYFHLDSRSESQSINAHKFTGEAWTSDRQDAYDAANRSALIAGVFYGLGGAVLLGTAIAYIVTEPKMETTVIHPHIDPKPTALVAPTRGGALVGGTWSF